jgi:(S)-sulfolactate dehydrogenase
VARAQAPDRRRRVITQIGLQVCKNGRQMTIPMLSEFQKQLDGWSLATAEILYRMPDAQSVLQTFVWQDYDLAPRFPQLQKFLSFWERELDGPIHSVRSGARHAARAARSAAARVGNHAALTPSPGLPGPERARRNPGASRFGAARAGGWRCGARWRKVRRAPRARRRRVITSGGRMPQIVISEFMDEAALAGFGAGFDLLNDPSLVDDRPRLLAAVAGADGLIVRNRTQVDAELLAAAARLKVVGRLGVGLDNIDMGACAARGVAVKPAVGANALSVAEYVICAAMVLVRGCYRAEADMLAGRWPRMALVGGEVAGRTLGLWGYGSIAKLVARKAAALEMRVIAHDPHLPDGAAWAGAGRVSAEALLAQADVLSLHVPLTDETRGLISAAALAAMKPGAVLINTARGGVVDEAALAAALREGRLGGAALDVFEAEPLGADAAQVFAGCPNLILTPHVAGVTEEGNVRVSAVTVENVRAALEGA